MFHSTFQDLDRTSLSENLSEQFTGSGYFQLTGESSTSSQALDVLVGRNADLVLVIPEGFEKELMRGGSAKVQLIINAEDGFSAGVIQGYTNDIITAFNRDLIPQLPRKRCCRPTA